MKRHRWDRSSNLLPAAVLAVAAFVAASLAVAVPATGQLGLMDAKKATLEVVADRTSYAPGSQARLAALVEIESGWHVNSNTPSYDWLIPTELDLTLPEGFAEPRLEYPKQKMQQFEFTEEPIAVYDGRFKILAHVDVPAGIGEGTYEVAASLRYQSCDHESCLPPTNAEATIELVVGAGGQAANNTVFVADEAEAAGGAPPLAAETAPTSTATSLFGFLFFAVIGGLLLNAMPCVLPVLSLKVFGLVKSASQGRSHVVKGCLATTFGILVSFGVLAGIVIAAKVAGEAVGWGMQFQHPGFVTFLAVVVLLFSLNLWGLFEIPLPQSLAQVGGSGSGQGMAGHFASGLFATLMATPCSAPYLGPAVGFAISKSPLEIFMIFLAIGVGLALPYLTLAVFPGAAKWLPRPGDWMVTFKGVMGFLLAATLVWLFYVLDSQVSRASLAYIQVALIALALFTWLFSRTEAAPGKRRFASVGILATVLVAIVLAVNSPPPASAEVSGSKYFEWVSFDEAQAERLRDDGRLVFIDFTADWCFTCKTIERTVIETSTVAEAFEKHKVVTMKADWTNPDDKIAAFLSRYGRSAVPFYVLYRPDAEPHVFGEILTQGQILEVLGESG